MLVWVLVQTVENGGFSFLFEHPMPADDDYSRTLEALDSIGVIDANEVMREAMSQFRGQRPPLDPLERSTEYRALPDKTRDRLDAAFLDLVPEIARRLLVHIADNLRR